MRTVIPTAGLLILLACSSQTARVESTAIVYEGARLINGGVAVENSAFVVDGGKFTVVGTKGSVDVPAGAARVNLSGKTVIPALIDTHAHLGWVVLKSGAVGAETYSKANLIDHLQRAAYYGVGVVRNLGIDPGEVPYEVRANPTDGAALFRTAGRGMAMPNAGPGRAYWKPIAYGVSTEAEARKAVQELAAKRVDIVKIWVDDRNGTVKKLTPALYRVIIDEAHKNNLKVAAHIFYLADAKELLRAGIDGFAHGVRDRDVDEEFVQLIKAHPNVWVVPNLPENPDSPTDEALLAESLPSAEIARLKEEAAKLTPDALKEQRRLFGIQSRNLAKLNAAGVKIALGTDSSSEVGWNVHSELADMVASGMTAAQVLTAATKTAAEVMGLDEMGTVAVGKSADFAVLDGDPLASIANTKRIARVVLRGKEINRQALRDAWTK